MKSAGKRAFVRALFSISLRFIISRWEKWNKQWLIWSLFSSPARIYNYASLLRAATKHVRLHPLWSAAKSVWKIIRWQGDMLAKKLCTSRNSPVIVASRAQKREFTSSLTSFVIGVFWFNVQAIRVKWHAHMSETCLTFFQWTKHNKEAWHRAQIRLNQLLLHASNVRRTQHYILSNHNSKKQKRFGLLCSTLFLSN